MKDKTISTREQARLAALHAYAILDTPPEAIFDGIARIAARICDTPVAMVTFIDEREQFVKATTGPVTPKMPRAQTVCHQAIELAVPLIIEDAENDARTSELQIVKNAPHIRFYAGAPIRTEDGLGLGAVCVLDVKPRRLLPAQIAALEALADDVAARLEARRSLIALGESERLHRQLFADNPQPMWLFDYDNGQFIDVNNAAVSTYGWTRDEFLKMSVHDLWLAEDKEAKTARLDAGLPRYTGSTLTRHRRKDGSTIVVDGSGHEFYIDGRRAILGLVMDVTEREIGAAALLEANAKFAVAQRLAEMGSWETDVSTGALTGSDELHRLLGVAPGTISQHTNGFRAFVHPDDREAVFAARSACETEGGAMSIEHRIVRSDGTTRWVHTQGRVQRPNAQGRVLFVGTVHDITNRREAEIRLREQAELIEAARDAIMLRDMDNIIVSWNGGAERLFGWTAAEAIGQDGTKLLHRDREAVDRAVERVIATGHWTGELHKYTKAGDEVVVDGSWTLLRHEDGRPKGILVINTDVTDKRKIETQFLRAQRMESIGTLAGGIAHDLNNMLAPILMSIELLRMTITTGSSAELLETIETSARRGADLVKQVLTFARGVEGQREDLTATHLIDDVAKFARDTFPPSIEVVSKSNPALWWVTGDRTQLHQVLINLMVNARDAMPSGGRLEISAENVQLDQQYAAMTPEAKASGYVVIQVSDSGSGISPAIRERIFEPFFTTKGVGEGTGLGLATVQAIVRSHGGFVTVYSEMGVGATFKIYLPALDAHASRVVRTIAEPLPRGRGERVLVVDDEAAIRDISRQTLEAFGYAVIVASDGAEALAIFARQGSTIDAVITDIMMPIMDGPSFIQAVRRLDPDIPIIAASGLTTNGSHTAPLLGVRHFLSKPYTADAMLRALRDALAERPERSVS